MGKITGFLEYERLEEGYQPVDKRLKSYREFVIGLKEDEAAALIVRGFIEPIAKELPLEYAVELNKLIELEMEGSVG